MSDYIPHEIWREILKKLTPDTLVKFRCVCKSWNSLISSQSFITAHLASQKPHLIAKESHTRLEPENYVAFRPQHLPSFGPHFRGDRPSSRLVGTVNGVMCLANEANDIVLWNPSIRKSIYPPKYSTTSSLGFGFGFGFGSDSTLGFGFDPSKNDLKVVRIIRVTRGDLFGRRGHGHGQPPPRAEIFSALEGAWRTVRYGVLDCHTFPNRWSQCLLNGAAHWPAYVRSTSRTNVLLSFRFEDEVFETIELPRGVEIIQASVSKIGDMLSVVHYKRAVGAAWAHGCDVWAMGEYGEARSWCKMVSVDWDWGGGGLLGSVVWVREDVGEMIVSTESGEVLCYDARNREARSIGVRCEGDDDGWFADGFVRSLVLLDV